MKKYSYKEFKVIQYDDNDVEITKNGKLVFHGQFEKELTEFELYKVVDDFQKVTKMEAAPLDFALAEYLMTQGVVTEPCEVGNDIFYTELGRVKKGKYIGVSKDHVIVSPFTLNSKPFCEQIKDMYLNRYIQAVIIKNEDVYLTEEAAQKILEGGSDGE